MGPEPFSLELTRSLRDGATVDVHEAVSREGLSFLVKRLNPDRAPGDPVGALRFRRENTLATSLQHPGLATVAGHREDWIAFERLEPSLAVEACRRRYSRPREVRPLLSLLAGTLAYLHSRGVVHRDIKPAHVMFRGEQPVLVDLSVAGLVADDRLGGEIVGSPAWMSPEQAMGAAPHPNADVWSLCALGAWLMGGRAPHEADADALLQARKRGSWPVFDFSRCEADDPDLAKLLKKGLGAPETRPDSRQLQSLLQLR